MLHDYEIKINTSKQLKDNTMLKGKSDRSITF